MKIAKIYKQCARSSRPFSWVKDMNDAMNMIYESAQFEESEREWEDNNPQYLDEDGFLTQEGLNQMAESCLSFAEEKFKRDESYDCGDFVLQIVPDDTQLQELDRPWS